jgi:tetratricopeptide (TPR) repeat protein
MAPDEIRLFEEAIDKALARWNLSEATRLAAEYRSRADRAPPDAATGDGSPRFRSAVVSAQVALLASRPGDVSDLLTPLLPQCGPASSELGAQVRLLLAEGLARSGRREEARRVVAEVPAERLENDSSQALRAVRVRLLSGERGLDAEVARVAAVLQKEKRREDEGLLWCEVGRARYRAGDLPAAEHCWRRAEGLSQGIGLQPVFAHASLQRGRLKQLTGHLGQALEHLDRAARHGLPVQALEAHLIRVLVLLDLGQSGSSRDLAGELLPPGREIPSELAALTALVRALLGGAVSPELGDEALGPIRLAQGDREEARRLFTAALRAAEGPERRARLLLALGLLDGEGTAWLRQAEWLARQHDLPEVLTRGLVALGRQVAGAGDEEEARRLFEEAITLGEVQVAGVPGILGRRQERHTVLRHLLEAACQRRDPAAVFRYQERERGRLLLEWLASGPRAGAEASLFERPAWSALAGQLETCWQQLREVRGADRTAVLRRREQLLAERDRLFERYLLDRDRPTGGMLPAVPELAVLSANLPPGSLYVAPVLTATSLSLLAVTRTGASVLNLEGSGEELAQQTGALREEISQQLARYRGGWPLGPEARAELDGLLETLGDGPLGRGLDRLLREHAPRRLLWVPDAALAGVPVHALRLGGRYLIEQVEVAWGFGGALLVQQRRTRRRGRWRPAIAVSEPPEELPGARREAEGVAAAFLRGRCLPPRVRREELRRWLGRAGRVHFACHAEFDPDHPLGAFLRLPSGELLHALEWLEEPVSGLPLVTLSACRAGEVAPLAGGEVFGLVTGLLGGGVRAVVAGLWPVADAESPPLMWSFYRQLMRESLPAALARAQREALACPGGSPLFWAAFALFGDPDAVGPAPIPFRWLASWRQQRHAQRYPGPGVPAVGTAQDEQASGRTVRNVSANS